MPRRHLAAQPSTTPTLRLAIAERLAFARALTAATCVIVTPAMATEATEAQPSRAATTLLVAQLGDLFYPDLRELRARVEGNRHLEAARLYIEKRASIDGSGSDAQVLVKAAADGLNRSMESRLIALRARVDAWRSNATLGEDQWQGVKTDVNEARRGLEEYRRLPLVPEPAYQSPQFAQLLLAVTLLERRLRDEAWEAFAGFDHAKKSFFTAYPESIEASTLLATDARRLTDLVDRSDVDTLGGLYRNYGHALPKDVRRSVLDGVVKRLTDKDGIRIPYWEALPAATARGIQISNAGEFGAKLVFVPSPEGSRLDVPAGEVMPDGFDPCSLSDQPNGFGVVLIESGVTVDRKISSRQKVQGRYVRGEQRLPNPAYANAQAAFIRAQSELNSIQINNAMNRSANIAVAVMQGLLEGAAAGKLNEAQQALARTPPTLTEKVYGAYDIDVVTLAAEKTSTYEIVLIDSPTATAKRVPQTLTQTQVFSLAYCIRDDDPDAHRHHSTHQSEQQVARWEATKTPLKLDLGRIISDAASRPALPIAAMGKLAAISTAAAAAAAPAKGGPSATVQDPLIRDDPRFASVVVVRSQTGALGTGFFVSEFQILTNQHVVEGSKIVEVKLRDGRTGVGQVERVDIGADLALVRVTQRGQPVSMQGGRLTAGESVEAIGHPRGLEYSITRGVVSAVRRMRNPSIPASNELVVIQTDTPINPGNSGGPLYRGSEVIGVNTRKLTGTEGMGFAVHSSEVVRFLAAP